MWNLRRVDGAYLGRCKFGRENTRGCMCATNGAEHGMEGSDGESWGGKVSVADERRQLSRPDPDFYAARNIGKPTT